MTEATSHLNFRMGIPIPPFYFFSGDLLNQGSNGRRSGSFSSVMHTSSCILFQILCYFSVCFQSVLLLPIISYLAPFGKHHLNTSSLTSFFLQRAPFERHGAFRNRAAEKEIRKELKLLLVLDNPFIIKLPWLQVY